MDNLDWNATLKLAHQEASLGQVGHCMDLIEQIMTQHSAKLEALSASGHLLLNYGFPSKAKAIFEKILKIEPTHLGASINLAQTMQLLGDFETSAKIYQGLINMPGLEESVHRSYISSLEYCPNISNEKRLEAAKNWANIAIGSAGGKRARPPKKALINRPLKVGYVSGDFCQHTVGIFFKEILKAHKPEKVQAYAYSSGINMDWITQIIQEHSHFRKTGSLSDRELARLIEEDEIDILVDLSGHTAGSRLSCFACRPAPVMVSWLGYYATTGLEYIDAVLLDQWHATPANRCDFFEPIELLRHGRLCFYPAFPAPFPTDPPSIGNGYITFGSFNNTLKYNDQIFSLWAKVLHDVPNSRLLLKWRTFNDSQYCETIWKKFTKLGIEKSRIELRGPSFHMQMLEEYKDVDIALDPFPFSGGLTSCEALYMGVPVITYPQDRVVSRQTNAFLHTINHPEWIAYDKTQFIDIAKKLAANPDQLKVYRNNLRLEMINSPLMKVREFTYQLEDKLIEIFNKTK